MLLYRLRRPFALGLSHRDDLHLPSIQCSDGQQAVEVAHDAHLEEIDAIQRRDGRGSCPNIGRGFELSGLPRRQGLVSLRSCVRSAEVLT